MTKSWFSHIIKMQGDTTCVSVASTDYFGLSIMLWAIVGGEYIPRHFLFWRIVMEELSICIAWSGNFGDIVNRTGE